MRLKFRLHFHSDPNWEIRGVHRYDECSCGARRVRRAYRNMNGPVADGWPDLVNRHGQPLMDSGWHEPQ